MIVDCSPQIVNHDENTRLQSGINDILFLHNCDMDDVNGNGWMKRWVIVELGAPTHTERVHELVTFHLKLRAPYFNAFSTQSDKISADCNNVRGIW